MPRGSRRAARAAQDRRERREGREHPARLPAGERVEDGWVVRSVPGTSSPRPYRCPGCDQELVAAAPHVVAWPQGRPEDRRHWHTACWGARDRRGVKVQRSRNAPRYG